MGRKRKEIVAVANNIMDFNYATFSVNECRIWFALLAAVRDKDVCEVEIGFSEFAKIAGVSYDRTKYISALASEVGMKIQGFTGIKHKENGYIDLIWFFDRFQIDENRRTIKFSVSPRYKAWVNNLMGGFTKFDLEEFTPLPTRACQELYLILKRNLYKHNDGKPIYVSVETLKERLGLDNYRAKDITSKIVRPAVSELNWLGAFGKTVQFDTVRNSRKIVGYEFTFGENQDEWSDDAF